MPLELYSSLVLSAPELIIAGGALVLLMVGVFSGERANTTVTGLTVAVLIAASAWIILFGEDVAVVLRHGRRRQHDGAGTAGEQKGLEDPHVVQTPHFVLPSQKRPPANEPAMEIES